MCRMHNPPHPGELLEEYLKPTGLTQQEAADCLDISRQQLGAVLNGRADITPEMAVRLALAFDTTAEFWLNMQMLRDLWMVDQAGLPKVTPIIKPRQRASA